MRVHRYLAAGIFFALLIAACQSSPAPTTQAEVAQPESAVQQLPSEAPANEPQLAAPPVEEEPTKADAEPVEVRQDLAATDPATVNLASGTPTFVEFFAFW